MAAKHTEERTEEVGRFSVGARAEVTIQIAERGGQQFIVITEHRRPGPPTSTEHEIEIPAALLPQLVQAVAALEENLTEEADPSRQIGPPQPFAFAHPSEEEFARILDFYHIRWEYECRTFALEWDDRGTVISSFTPDFYLPEHDLYIELTTLKQSLVTRKNRKVRQLKEIYPEVNIKVLYASDYRKLIEKFAASGTWQEPEQDGIVQSEDKPGT